MKAILFSGGLDSTYMLFDALKKYQDVHVFMLDIAGWPDLMARQKVACSKILDLFESPEFKIANRLGCIVSTQTLKAYDSIALSQQPINGFRQASIITKALLEFSAIHEVSSVSVGLVKGDNGVPTFNHYQNAWESLYRVTYPHRGDPPKIIAPIVSMSKEDILRELPNSVLKLVEWCGSHNDTYSTEAQGCGGCPSCLTMARTLVGAKYFNPSLYGDKLKSMSDRYDSLIELTNKRTSR